MPAWFDARDNTYMRGRRVPPPWLALALLPALLAACQSSDFGNPNAIYPGTPRPFPTSGVEVSNACGLLPPQDVYDALGSSSLSPRTGTAEQPPNCTWVTVDDSARAGELVLEVSSSPDEVARVRAELAPPLPDGARPVPHLGSGALVEASGRVLVLVDSRTVLVARLSRGDDVTAEQVRETVVRLARLALQSLAARRPAGGQLLATPEPARPS
jgi:hypothetical protein